MADAVPWVRVSQYIVEALVPFTKPVADTPTGAGVSQYVVEALMEAPAGHVRVGEYVIEVLMAFSDTQTEPPEPPEPGGDAGVRVFGYAG